MLKLKCVCAWTLLVSLWTFLGVRVGQDYDVQTVFSRYKSFDFSEAPQPDAGPSVLDNPFLKKRIRQAIENTLVEKGYQKPSGGVPDFWVDFHWATVPRVAVDYAGDGWLGHRYPGDSAFETTVQQYDEGTVTIDFIDAPSKKLFWRGTGTRRVDKSSSVRKSVEYTQKWVDNILKQFPPGATISQPAASGCSSPSHQTKTVPPQT